MVKQDLEAGPIRKVFGLLPRTGGEIVDAPDIVPAIEEASIQMGT